MSFDDVGLKLIVRTVPPHDHAELAEGAKGVFKLFLAREPEFGFNPQVGVDYPDLAAGADSPFLADALAYVAERVAALEAQGDPIGRVVILTTYADAVGPALTAAGWTGQHIDMPAGPDGTWTYSLERSEAPRTLYIEAVNEADPKIRADFLLELTDVQGRLRGGAWGSIHARDRLRYAYIATMTLDAGLAPGVGTRLGQALDEALIAAGVSVAHLGTQTAGPFYERLGYRITHRVLPALRERPGEDGVRITTDLVMMEKRLG